VHGKVRINQPVFATAANKKIEPTINGCPQTVENGVNAKKSYKRQPERRGWQRTKEHAHGIDAPSNSVIPDQLAYCSHRGWKSVRLPAQRITINPMYSSELDPCFVRRISTDCDLNAMAANVMTTTIKCRIKHTIFEQSIPARARALVSVYRRGSSRSPADTNPEKRPEIFPRCNKSYYYVTNKLLCKYCPGTGKFVSSQASASVIIVRSWRKVP